MVWRERKCPGEDSSILEKSHLGELDDPAGKGREGKGYDTGHYNPELSPMVTEMITEKVNDT